MKSKNPIKVLLENGIQFKTLSNMSDKQIKVLAEKLMVNEQATTPQNTTPQTITTTKYIVKPNSKTMVNGVEIDTTGGKTTATPIKEKEITEKFESKAQQGLFWARCNKCSDKNCKWCKMAKEFSKDTTKKEYESMPEKKHPEKTVKYKKTQNENYDQELEDIIIEMISKHINPKVTKKNISEKSDSMILKNPKKLTMFQDESGIEMKTPIEKLQMMKSEMSENGTKEKEAPTKPGIKTPTRRKNPFKDPSPGVKEKPRGEKEEIKQDFITSIKRALS